MTKHVLPPAHSIGCYCAACVLKAWDEFHDQAPIGSHAEALAEDALARAEPTRWANNEVEREYQLYLAAVTRWNNLGKNYTVVPQDQFSLAGWLACDGRTEHLAWQAQERTTLMELAREEGRQDGRQSSLEGGYSASPDLCGPSSTDDLEETGDLPSVAELEAALRRSFTLSENSNLREVKAFERACEDMALYGVGVYPGTLDTYVATREAEKASQLGPYPGKVSILPTGYDDRKAIPVATGALDYFPLAIAAVAQLSRVANDQHNPGEPLHWAREKSTDEANTLLRHFMERGARDADGQRHSAKVAWRALALLQKEIEQDGGAL